MPEGYCTTEDLRRALRKAGLPGDASQDPDIAVDAITAQTEWAEKTLLRHWYAPAGADILSEAQHVTIPTGPKTRDDEHDIPTHGAEVFGASENERYRFSRNSDALLESGPRYERRRRHWSDPKQRIRVSTGRADALDRPRDEDVPAYTRITFDRRDVSALNELHVVNDQGGYDDWVADSAYEGGVGNSHRGEDFWVRTNNGGVTELYLDVHAMDDNLTSLSNAVYVDIDYGHEGIPRTFRRAIAFRAAADLAEDAVIEIPQNATLYGVEAEAEALREKADELIDVYRREESI